MPFTAKENREYRAQLKAEGKCPLCREPLSNDSATIRCAECNKRTALAKRERRKDKSKCMTCENPLDEFTIEIGSVLCPNCKESLKVRGRRSYYAKK